MAHPVKRAAWNSLTQSKAKLSSDELKKPSYNIGTRLI